MSELHRPRSSIESIAPVKRSPASVADGHDGRFVLLTSKNDDERESLKDATPKLVIAGRQFPKRKTLWIAFDAIQGPFDFVQQVVAQAEFFAVIPRSGLNGLSSRFRKNE
jgi:hypothetical protein